MRVCMYVTLFLAELQLYQPAVIKNSIVMGEDTRLGVVREVLMRAVAELNGVPKSKEQSRLHTRVSSCSGI